MPGYGILGPNQGSGLLPWSWAEERLIASHAYWLSTVRPDGRPHAIPVWGVWFADVVWLSSGLLGFGKLLGRAIVDEYGHRNDAIAGVGLHHRHAA